ncbi:MAG TPA: histidine kinase [Kofleriaceae bacterium]|nr:histidine kinase [Kofleriaceae bacterium]
MPHAPAATTRRWQTWALILACWLVVGLADSSHLYVYHSLVHRDGGTWLLQVAEAFADFGAWAALTPVVLVLVRRFPLAPGRWPRALLIHIPAALVVSLVQVSLHEVLDMGLIHGEWTAAAMSDGFRMLFARTYHFGVLVYLGIVAVHQAIAHHRAQAVRAAGLESALTRAQLHALEMQLHPHFLFNTLHAISALMHTDVRAADQMLARLGELLRASLAAGGAQEVPLRRELDLLDRYLDIEKVRFGDRLTVVIDIDPQALDARVPNLILQPLVENAIRHGISRKRGAGRVEIRATCSDDTLELTVRDDGPGLPAAGVEERIGLSNTRQRLEQLHGADHTLALRARPGGGAELIVTMPLHLRARG